LATLENFSQCSLEHKKKKEVFKSTIDKLIKEYKLNNKVFKKSYSSKVLFNESFQ
jgi:hypothetical protein